MIQNKRRTSIPANTGSEFLKSTNGYFTPDNNKSKLHFDRRLEIPRREDNNSSVSSSTNTVASLNRSRDSGFFQEGANERSISSFTFDNLSSKNRSMADQRSQTLGVLPMVRKMESWTDSGRVKGDFDVGQPNRNVHQQGPSDLKDKKSRTFNEINAGNKIRPFSSSIPKDGFVGDSNIYKFQDEINSKIFDDDYDDDESYFDDTRNHKYFENNQKVRNVAEPFKSIPGKHSTTDNNTNASNPHPFDSLNANHETNLSRRKTNNVNSFESGQSRRFKVDGRTRAPEKVTMITDDGLNSFNENSIQGEKLFDMFGYKLSDVCRQLLLSDRRRKSISSESTNSSTISDRSIISNGIDKGSMMDIDNEDDNALEDDFNQTRDLDLSKNLEDSSKSDDPVKSIAPEFSLKIDKQPTWSMTPVLPEPLHYGSASKDTHVPLYCKVVRQSLKDNADEGNTSSQTSNSESKIDDRSQHFEEQNHHNQHDETDIFRRTPELKTYEEPSKDIKMKNKLINNDATIPIETKQTSLTSSGRRSYLVKSLKTSTKSSKSNREKKASRKKKEYIHEISLEIIKTIEEELRISHQWNGVSPSKTIARRLDQILSSHQQKRLHFGLTEPSDRELYELLIDRISSQDPDYFPQRGARIIPLRSLSPPRQIENLLREDSGFNLEKKLALLLRMENAEDYDRRNVRDDFEPAVKYQPFLQLHGVHQTYEKNFKPDVYDVSSHGETSSRSDNLNQFIRSKNDVSSENTDATSKPLKKKNVMQTQIPLNDKVLEIVLNVSESPETSHLNFHEINNQAVHRIITDGDVSDKLQTEKIFKQSSCKFDRDSNDVSCDDSKFHRNEKMIIATEFEGPKHEFCFNLSSSSEIIPHSKQDDSEWKHQLTNQSINQDQSIEGGNSINKLSSKDQSTDSPDVTSMEQLVKDVVFEVNEQSIIEPHLNKSYQSLSLENKLKSPQKRRIKIMSSQSSDGVIVSMKENEDNLKPDNTGEQTAFKDSNVSDINNNTNVTSNNNATNDINNNKNMNNKKSVSSDSSSDKASINLKREKSSDRVDQVKTRKRVSFNPDLDTSDNNFGGDATPPSDRSAIHDTALSQGHFEGLQRNQESREIPSEPSKTIFVNKYLEFSGNTVKETNLVLTPTDSSVIDSINKNNLATLPEIMRRNVSSGERDVIDDSINSLQSILQTNRGEPIEIELSQMKNLKISVPRAPCSTPSPPRLIRNLNPVKVTDFGQAQIILRKAFKDRNFGKAYDDSDVVPFSIKAPFIISKRKSRKMRLNNLDADEELIEKVLKDVEVQTEDEIKCYVKVTRSEEIKECKKGISFSFLTKLCLALFVVIMAIVIFYIIGDQSIDFSSMIDRRNPVG